MRARNIKPGFFINEDLGDVDAIGRLLFIGLWCLSDREGKLEDRPKRIKGELFRYDDISSETVDRKLSQLAQLELIIRYEIEGLRYIFIPNFLKHQSPHYNEKPSTIPDPLLTKVESACHQGDNNLQPRKTALPPDSLNPDSLNPDSQKKTLSPGGSPPPSKKPFKKTKTPIPDGFGISEQVRTWAQAKGFGDLEDHLEVFKDLARSNGYEKADWDSTFKRAIREDWGKVRQSGGSAKSEGARAMEAAEARMNADPTARGDDTWGKKDCPKCKGRGVVQIDGTPHKCGCVDEKLKEAGLIPRSPGDNEERPCQADTNPPKPTRSPQANVQGPESLGSISKRINPKRE